MWKWFLFKESGLWNSGFCVYFILFVILLLFPFRVSPTQVLQIPQGLFYPVSVWAIHHLQQICHPQTETTQKHPEKNASLTCLSCCFFIITPLHKSCLLQCFIIWSQDAPPQLFLACVGLFLCVSANEWMNEWNECMSEFVWATLLSSHAVSSLCVDISVAAHPVDSFSTEHECLTHLLRSSPLHSMPSVHSFLRVCFSASLWSVSEDFCLDDPLRTTVPHLKWPHPWSGTMNCTPWMQTQTRSHASRDMNCCSFVLFEQLAQASLSISGWKLHQELKFFLQFHRLEKWTLTVRSDCRPEQLSVYIPNNVCHLNHISVNCDWVK